MTEKAAASGEVDPDMTESQKFMPSARRAA